jgi:hypothetical protein
LQALEPPSTPWRYFSLDFVIDLPESKGLHSSEIYDSVLVLIDRFTKLVQYIPYRKTIDAPVLAKLIWRIFLQSGTPASLVSDCGSVFTSEYWSMLCYHLRIQLRMYTTFHLQTDGQTECQKQELEAYLCMFVNYEQDDWVELLPIAEFAYNSKWNSSMKYSPIELTYGIYPIFPDSIAEDDWVTNALEIEGQASDPSYQQDQHTLSHFNHMQNAHKAVMHSIKHALDLQAKYYNKRHLQMQFAEGQEVLLSAKNIRTKCPYKKLDAKFLGLFKILQHIRQQSYKLDLPPSMSRLHPVFHAQLLESYTMREGFQPPAVELLDDGK